MVLNIFFGLLAQFSTADLAFLILQVRGKSVPLITSSLCYPVFGRYSSKTLFAGLIIRLLEARSIFLFLGRIIRFI